MCSYKMDKIINPDSQSLLLSDQADVLPYQEQTLHLVQSGSAAACPLYEAAPYYHKRLRALHFSVICETSVCFPQGLSFRY